MPMAHEMLVGLFVSDETAYAQYRSEMRPILERHSGRFRYDFTVSRVLQAESEAPINRVFIIAFETRADQEAFFADPEYLPVRARHFDRSVQATTILAEYERDA